MNEKIQTVKYLVIGAVICIVSGMVGGILLRRDNPILAGYMKSGGFILGFLLFGIGIIWTMAGDTILKKIKTKKTPEQTQAEYAQRLKEHNLKLNEMKLQTALKAEEAKQKQMDNQINLQRAKINQMNSKTGSKSNDVLGNLSGMLSSNQPKQKPVQPMMPPSPPGNLDEFMIVKRPNKQKKKKKKVNDMDGFFMKF